MALILELIDLVVILIYGTMNDLYNRGYYVEFAVTFKHGLFVGACQILYLFLMQEGQNFSRLTLLLTIVIYIVISYFARICLKKYIGKNSNDKKKERLLLVSTEEQVKNLVKNIEKNKYSKYKLIGLVIIDKELVCLLYTSDAADE